MQSAELKGYGYQYCGIGLRNHPPILKEHIYSFLTKKIIDILSELRNITTIYI